MPASPRDVVVVGACAGGVEAVPAPVRSPLTLSADAGEGTTR
ncbi:Uncharacterised protein [Amycolatopsis camponoti]|uniref:Uncharacterized protein n=1 Tax=Amycolatopsis camponoti TaxID=2606593 RepID=A0A6I8LSQ0_9PSEU|nr:Uncharacterised protein [Amycolatopsis camponoti]